MLIRQLPGALLLVHPTPWSGVPRIAAAIDPIQSAERSSEIDEALVDVASSLSNVLAGAQHADAERHHQDQSKHRRRGTESQQNIRAVQAPLSHPFLGLASHVILPFEELATKCSQLSIAEPLRCLPAYNVLFGRGAMFSNIVPEVRKSRM